MENKEEIIFNEPRKTFMEVLKVHNKEVPFANLLAFFFKPKEKHNLDTLFIDAFLEIASVNAPKYEKTKVKVIVEQPTDSKDPENPKKRIDILIITDTFVICIEFKINHVLNNPLDEYKAYVEKNFSDSRSKYYFVLAPKKLKAVEKAKDNKDFKQIILSHFIKKVKEKFNENNEKYKPNESYDYFKDFIQTVENRKIRYERNLILEELKKGLIKQNVSSEYHKNTKGGFLEIDKKNYKLKVRFKSEGIQIEKWENKSFLETVYGPNKSLETIILIDKILKL